MRRTLALTILSAVVVVIITLGYLFVIQDVGPAPSPPPSPTGVSAEFVNSRSQPFLDSYGWVDQKNQIAHIPITRAMEIVAQKGLPSQNSAPDASAPGREVPSYSSSGTQNELWLH